MLGKAKDEIISKFRDVVKKFQGFLRYLIKKMFDFVGEIQELAEEKKFTMSEISMEFPPFGIEVVTVAGFPIPIPKIQAPKLTVTFKPLTSE